MYDKLFFDTSKTTIEYAKQLRQRQTDAEIILWNCLRNRKINGCKFRRQHAINKFIVDFYCAEKMLSIEVDGEIHLSKEQKEYDENRTKILNGIGITELRFSNKEVIENTILVINKIKTELNK